MLAIGVEIGAKFAAQRILGDHHHGHPFAFKGMVRQVVRQRILIMAKWRALECIVGPVMSGCLRDR